jgi:hypothetical protein
MVAASAARDGNHGIEYAVQSVNYYYQYLQRLNKWTYFCLIKLLHAVCPHIFGDIYSDNSELVRCIVETQRNSLLLHLKTCERFLCFWLSNCKQNYSGEFNERAKLDCRLQQLTKLVSQARSGLGLNIWSSDDSFEDVASRVWQAKKKKMSMWLVCVAHYEILDLVFFGFLSWLLCTHSDDQIHIFRVGLLCSSLWCISFMKSVQKMKRKEEMLT